MNKKQQIEEMTQDFINFGITTRQGVEAFAEALYNAGYRKIENGNGHNLPHEIEYLLTEFDKMGFAPTNFCDAPEAKAKLWKSALVYEIELLLDEHAVIRKKAIEEFAEKCKERIDADYINGMLNNHRGHLTQYDIDELVKEFER